MNNLVDTVEFRARSPRQSLPGLDAARQGLRAISTELDAINGKLSGLSTASAFKRTRSEIQSLLKENLNISQKLPVRKVAEVLGIPDVKDFQAFVQRWKATHKDLSKSFVSGSPNNMVFTSGAKAAEISKKYFTSAMSRAEDQVKGLQSLLSGGGSRVEGRVGKIELGGGDIPLIIPANRIIATLGPGAIAVQGGSPQSTVHSSRSGGGAIVGGAPGSGANGPLIGEVVTTRPGKQPVVRRTYLQAIGKELEIAEQAGAEIGRKATTSIAKQQAEKFRAQLASVKATLQQEMELPQQQRDYGRIAALRRDASDTARALVSGKKGQDLRAMGLGSTVAQIEGFASTQGARSGADQQRAMVTDAQKVFRIREELARARERGDKDEAQRLNSERRQMEKRIASQNRMVAAGQRSDDQKAKQQAKVAALSQAVADGAVRQRMSHAAAERGLADFLGQGGTITRETGREVVGKNGPAFARTVTAEREVGGNKHVFTARFDETGASVERMTKKLSAAREEIGYLGGDFLRNTAKVTLWAASVGVLYKSMELMRYSIERTLEIGEQFRRLDQVFKKVGGSTQDLTSDVMHLAAENGRSTDEAMQSALQWARLGLTRSQINEAVRVSMMAANDANVSAAETTEKLQAVMQTYGLSVGELRGTLSEIVQITNSYNVSTGDMLDGLSRTAAAAKQAGLPLAELMGLLGATVGSTGQSGANIGNAIKSITLALSNPALQQKLRTEYRFESTTGGEEIKGMSALLSDLYVKYMHLNDAQRQSLLFNVAGRTQANRLSAMLDNYVKAQTLAVNAQLNLNTAEEENKKIKAALITQLRALGSEWERFAVIQGNHGPVQVMTQLSTALRNLLTLANSGGGMVATGILGLLFAGGAKTVLSGMNVRGSGGFLGRTGARLRETGGALNNTMIDVYNSFIGGGLATNVGTRRTGVVTRVGTPIATGPIQAGMARVLDLTGRWQMSNNRLVQSLGAVTRSLGVGMIALRQWALPLIAVELAVVAFNKVMETAGATSEAAERKLAGVSEEAQKAASAANAYAQAADALRTIQQALKPQEGFGGIRPEDQRRMLAQSAELMFQDEPDLSKREKLTTEMRKQLELLRQQGNVSQIQNILENRRNGYLEGRKAKLQEQYEAMRQSEQAMQNEIVRLQAVSKSPIAFIGRETRQNKISELQRRMEDLSGDKVRNQVEQNNAYEERLQYDEKHQAALEGHKLTMQSIAEIFNAIGSNNPLDRSLVHIASLNAQLGSLQKRREELSREDDANLVSDTERKDALAHVDKQEKTVREDLMQTREKWKKVMDIRNSKSGAVGETISAAMSGKGEADAALDSLLVQETRAQHLLDQIAEKRKNISSGRTGQGEIGFASRQKQRAELDEEEKGLRAQIAAHQANLPNVEKQMRFQFGQEQGRRDSSRSFFGFDETDKMIHQVTAVHSQMKELEQKPNLSLQERGRQLELETQYYHTIINLRERAATIERDINQLVFDRAREMQRSLFEAGPNELLRKLAAFRTAFDKNGQLKNLSAGAMMAMSPDFRKEVGGAQFTGIAAGERAPRNIFDPQLIELLNERNRARPWSGQGQDSNAGLDQFQRDLSAKLGDMAAAMAKEIPSLFTQASAVLDSFADKISDRVIPALDAFAERLDKISGGGASAAKPSGQYGGTGAAAGNLNKAAFAGQAY